MSRSASNKNTVATKPKVKAVAANRKLPPPNTPPASLAGSQQVSLASGYMPGDRVSHPKFGNGVVRSIDADKLTIQFTRNVVKQIVDYYVKHRLR